MIGIISSGILTLMAVILRITLGSLTDKFEFLESWLRWFNYLIIGFAVITVIFVIVVLIKTIKK
ncbi:MAG: hypothetical protein HFK05_04280 [Clostridia bacterium]|nr:hypothetical protein [Clostridia bacterium]